MGCSSPCRLHSWQFAKCNYPIFFKSVPLSTWPESFYLCMSSHLFYCTCCVSVRCPRICLCVFVFYQDLTMKLSLIQSVGLIAKAISECVKKQGYIFTRKQELITVMLVSSESLIVCQNKSWIFNFNFWSLFLLLYLPRSGFYQGRASGFIEDSSAPSCDDHLC